MGDNQYREDKEHLQEILKQYENLRLGRAHSFLEEEAFQSIINYYEDRENLAKANEAANLAIDQYPYSASLMIRKADLLLAGRRYQEALDVLDHAALLDNNDTELFILKTEAFLALERHEEAVNLLEQSITKFEGEERIELLFELSDVYDDYEEFDKVFDCLKLILEQDPSNEEALFKICFWTDFTGRNEESIRLHTHIIDETPYNELAWFNLATAYQGLKLYEKAIDAYQYAIVIEEKFDYAYRNLADAYMRLRKYKEAIESLEKVNELAQPEAVIFEALAYCYQKLKKYAQARIYYRKASHLAPDDGRIFYKIAHTYSLEENWQACIKQVETALKRNETSADFNMLMGEAKMKLGLYNEAVYYLSLAVNTRVKNVNGWEVLIRCLYKAGFYEEALDQVDIGLFFTNHKPVLKAYKAAILFSLGKRKAAIQWLEKALTDAPLSAKKFMALDPAILQDSSVTEILARFKKERRK